MSVVNIQAWLNHVCRDRKLRLVTCENFDSVWIRDVDRGLEVARLSNRDIYRLGDRYGQHDVARAVYDAIETYSDLLAIFNGFRRVVWS